MDFVAVNSNKLQILGLEGKISWVFNVFTLLNLEIFNSKNVKNRKCVHIWANKTCYTNDDEVKRGKGLNWVPSLQEAFSSLHVLSILFFCMNFIVIMLYFIHILHLAFFKFFIIVVLFFFYFELYFSLTLLSLLPYLSSTSHFIFFKLHHHQYLFFFALQFLFFKFHHHWQLVFLSLFCVLHYHFMIFFHDLSHFCFQVSFFVFKILVVTFSCQLCYYFVLFHHLSIIYNSSPPLCHLKQDKFFCLPICFHGWNMWTWVLFMMGCMLFFKLLTMCRMRQLFLFLWIWVLTKTQLRLKLPWRFCLL
jgi:hypothetical protein